MIPTAQPWKTAVLVVFALLCALMFGYLYSGTGAKVPFTTGDDFRFEFLTDDAGNLAKASDVRIAGVVVGEVEAIENRGDEGALVRVRLDEEVGALHDGAEVRVGERSLVGEGVVTIVDGDGDELDSGTALPSRSVAPSVQLHDVLRSLDAPTRKSLGRLVRSLGAGVQGRTDDVEQLFVAIGHLGRSGPDVVEAIAAQSEDLKHLVNTTSDVLRALNTSNGQLGELFDGADAVTRATAGQAASLRQVIEMLPSTLAHGREAFGSLGSLSADLRPVVRDLSRAAPYLTTALEQLPATATDLRGLLPSLDSTLNRAPATLSRVPTVATQVSDLVPDGRDILAHANPVLRYVAPYGRELAAFFTNFRGVLNWTDEAGINYLRLAPVLGNTALVSGVPVYTGEITHTENPYPAPNGLDNITGHQRGFTRLHPDNR